MSRRVTAFVAAVLVASAASAADSVDLDRNGVLWRGESTASGLLLSGEKDGQTTVSSLVPFQVGMPGSSDEQIQVASDELTGAVAVVWQRNWSETTSEIIAAVWRDGYWEQVLHLTDDFSANPRNPVVRLSQVASTATDGSAPAVVKESFLEVMWWQGFGTSQGASYALLRLSAGPDDPDRVLVKDLDRVIPLGFGCSAEVPDAILQHPLFADTGASETSLLFYGSKRICYFHLVEVRFELEPADDSLNPNGITTVAQRRRHRPVFGVRALYPSPQRMVLRDARMLVGEGLSPVAYRVQDEQVQYVVFTQGHWSELRSLEMTERLTMDRAIPLVEKLAR